MNGPGLLALIGGDEFHPGNEPHDEVLAAAARGRGPAYVVATAAARSHPEAAVRHAASWFKQFDLDVVELRAYTRAQAQSSTTAAAASEAAFVYIVGGDPGLVASVLRETPVGDALIAAWRNGAVLAVVPNSAVLPHHNTFGSRWFPSARAALPEAVLIGVDERTCALWQTGEWRCLGSGGITVYPGGDASHHFRSGSVVTGIPAPNRGESPTP
jgi:cyanophycinase-like exopeptidase